MADDQGELKEKAIEAIKYRLYMDNYLDLEDTVEAAVKKSKWSWRNFEKTSSSWNGCQMTRFQTNSEGKEQVELGTTNTETKIFSVGVHVDANHADIAEITSDQMLEVDAIP